ncbi:MAG: tripartite tricarboxylate transporter TctB family protein [Acetobacterales bacterium]
MTDRNQSDRELPLYRTNRGVGLLVGGIFVLLLLYIMLGADSFRVLRDGFYLGTFPMIGAGACIICSAVMVFDRFRNREIEELGDLTGKGLVFVTASVAAGFIFIQLIHYIGFGAAGVVYLSTMLFVSGVRPVRNALMFAVGMTFGVYALFTIVGVPLALVPEWAGGGG